MLTLPIMDHTRFSSPVEFYRKCLFLLDCSFLIMDVLNICIESEYKAANTCFCLTAVEICCLCKETERKDETNKWLEIDISVKLQQPHRSYRMAWFGRDPKDHQVSTPPTTGRATKLQSWY